MTIIIDDAGTGDLLYGAVIGAYRDSTNEFKYEVIDVKYFKANFFSRKAYLTQASKIVSKLLAQMKPKPDEEIHICRGYIFDTAIEKLEKKFGKDKIIRVKVEGEAQDLTEIAYLDEPQVSKVNTILDIIQKVQKKANIEDFIERIVPKGSICYLPLQRGSLLIILGR